MSRVTSLLTLGLTFDLIWILCLASVHAIFAFPARIPIGALFDSASIQSRSAFRYQIDKHNNQSTSKIKLDKYEKLVDIEDTFQISRALCSTMSKGVFAFAGLTNRTTAVTTDSFGRNFKMPYVTSSSPIVCGSTTSRARLMTSHARKMTSHGRQTSAEEEEMTEEEEEEETIDGKQRMAVEDTYTVYVRPGVEEAILAITEHYGWTKAFYLYDSDEGVFRLEQMYHRINQDSLALDLDPVRIFRSYDCYDQLRQIDQRDQSLKRVIVDLSTRAALTDVLSHIIHLGMHRSGYHYILTDMAIDEVDLSDFRFGGVNITGFRLADPARSPVQLARREWVRLNPSIWPQAGPGNPLTLDAMLAIDSAVVLIRALSSMFDNDPEVFKNTFRRGQVYNNDTRGIQCRGTPQPWVHGPAIIKHFRAVSFTGLTGHVAFDEQGCRKHFTLDVFEINLNTNLQKIGDWQSSGKLHITRQLDGNSSGRNGSQNRSRIVTTIMSSPYLMNRSRSDDGHVLEGNELYEGYCADLARLIAHRVGFTYELRPVKDDSYGQKMQDGTWNGMVGELTRREADLAIAPLTISSMRERVIDFSKPFMNLGISIMIKKPEKQKPGVFSFMEPLSYKIWVCIVFSYLGVSLVLFLVSRLSPKEWHIDDTNDGPTFTNDFTMLNSLWFALGAFMQQGCDISPRSVSGRLAGSAWWFFTLIIISTYTANLAAFLTVERMLTPINSADDLAKQTQIQYGTIDSGSTKEFFRTSKISVYEKMWGFMGSTPGVFVKTTEEGVQKVRESKGKYAFLLESTMNDYFNQRQPCNTMKVGENLDSKGYGVATPIGSDLRDGIGLAVLRLREDGELQKLQKKWWFDKGECNPEGDGKGGSSTQSALTLSNVAGIFYILISGLGLSMAVSLVEFLCKSKSEAKKHKETFADFVRCKPSQFAPPPPPPRDLAPDDETGYNAASSLTTPVSRTPAATPPSTFPTLTRTSVV